MMLVSAVILAGGKGSRMNLDIPKQYLMLNDKPLLYYTIKAFEESRVDEIIVVTGDGIINGMSEQDYCQKCIIEAYHFNKVKAYAKGGRERYNSVMNGLSKVNPVSDYVMVHDGARPCVSSEFINRCVDEVAEYGSSVAAVPVKDTIKIVDSDMNVEGTPDRSCLWQIQTPQSFRYSDLTAAYNSLKKDDNPGNITDDAMVMEKYGHEKVHITQGDYTNIKVTTREDLDILNIFLKMC